MRRKQLIYYSEMSPFAVLGLALLTLGAFFLTLPILIAALVVFGAFAAYMAWKFTRALKKAQEEMLNEQQKGGTAAFHCQEDIIIDVTPEPDERPGIGDGRP